MFCHMLLLFFGLGSFIDAVAEDQRVDSRVEVLLRLARQMAVIFGLARIAPDELFDSKIVLLRSENILSSALVP